MNGIKPPSFGRSPLLGASGLVFACALALSVSAPRKSFSFAAPSAPNALSAELTDQGTIHVHPLDPAWVDALRGKSWTASHWTDVFSVHVVASKSSEPDPSHDSGAAPSNPSPGAMSAMWGSYRLQGDSAVFEPRFPLGDGQTYRVLFRASVLAERLATGKTNIRDVDVVLGSDSPSNRTPTTRVETVYPSVERVPVNLLKMYVYFSAPMSRGEAYRRVHLEELETGQTVKAFLEIEQELWGPDRRRLTLLLDPGRIKRGLRPHQELGLALVEGRRYRLTVEPSWRDASGAPLVEPFTKTFEVGVPDRLAPDPEAWGLEIPSAGGTEPLTLLIPEPLDHALLERLLEVRTGADSPVAGHVELSRHDSLWRFLPDEAWSHGEYRIVIPTILEDLAGNTVERLFDVDRQLPDQIFRDEEEVILTFTIE